MCKYPYLKTAILMAVLLATISIPALAQISTASVSGVVRDPAGAVVPKASVALLNVATGVERRSASNEAGNYVFLNVPPGDYTLSAGAAGFKTVKMSQFTLVVNQTATLDVQLEVGDVQSSVTVEAVGASVQAATSELGAAVTEKNVTDLPLSGRNFTQLLWLTPGAGPVSTAQGKGGGYAGAIGTFVQPSLNGQLNRSNMYLLDGIFDTEAFMGTYCTEPILDTIQEFKVQSHNDQAEFGQILGGTVNVATKSGTNELHGALWEFIRNDAFDARNTFLPSVTAFKQNMFGVQTGGPVSIPKIYKGKNRTFFSLAYEGYRYRSPAATLYRVPTAANLTGDFSDEPRVLFNPYTTRADPNNASAFIRDPFPGNQIPTSLFDSNIVAYTKATVPTPITTGVANRNQIDPTPLIKQDDAYNARIDHNIGQTNFFWFRISGTMQTQSSSSGRQTIYQTQEFRTRNIGVSYVHTFGPSGVFQAQFGSARLIYPIVRNFTTLPDGWFKQNNFSDNIAGQFIGDHRVDPSFTVTDWFSGGGYYQYNRPTDDKQYKASYSRVLGSHIFKMGGELVSVNNELTIETGSATFQTVQTASPQSSATTGSALASFLLGLPDSSGRRNTTETMRWGGVLGFYFEDQWKATKNLTLNYGLRYDHNFIPPMGRPQDNNIYTGVVDFHTGIYILQAAPPSCAVALTAPCLPGGVLPDHTVISPNGKIANNPSKNFGPRLGLAYRLGPKTALRTGASVVFDNFSGVQQAARNFAGMWPLIGFVTPVNINPLTSTPLMKVENPLPSAVIPTATPFQATGYFLDPNWKNAYSMQWNFGIQHQATNSTVLSLYYVGSGTRRLDVGGLYNVATTPGPGTPSLRYPYPYIVPSNWTRSWGSASYNSLQFMADGRYAKGLTYRISYTWSKNLDYGASGFFAAEDYSVQNPYNIAPDHSVSGYDLTHVFVGNWVYELPFGKGKTFQTGSRAVDYVVGGWQVNGIALLRSGQPYTLQVAGDLANTGNSNYLRPNVVGDWHVGTPTRTAWFNKAAFAAPAAYTFGNMGRNVLRSDWNRTCDLSVFRQFPIKGDRTKLEFRAEAFNVFNKQIYAAPTNAFTNATFGQVTAIANTPRQMQLSLKIKF
jgi:hypothetical protein